MELTQFKTVEQLAAAIKTLDMVTSVPLTDHSGDSAITGWTSYTQKVIEYKKIVGKLVFVNFRIVGTSDTTTVTFTLPYTEGQSGDPVNMILTRDAGTTWDVGYATMTDATVTCTQDVAGGGFTDSGIKGVYGQFWYQAA